MTSPTLEKYKILIEALKLCMPDFIDESDPNMDPEQINVLIQAKEIIDEN